MAKKVDPTPTTAKPATVTLDPIQSMKDWIKSAVASSATSEQVQGLAARMQTVEGLVKSMDGLTQKMEDKLHIVQATLSAIERQIPELGAKTERGLNSLEEESKRLVLSIEALGVEVNQIKETLAEKPTEPVYSAHDLAASYEEGRKHVTTLVPESAPIGRWAFIRALGQSDVRRGLGQLIAMARQLGK